ncbi:putative lipid II flippase FtsW [Candidatus Microgenomates bacterium]|nr:putative lipid II flippase FtsW [Candidatus Microgenomates bacterium]
MERRRQKHQVTSIEKVSKKLKGDKILFLTTLFLVVLGLVVIADASAPLALSTFGNSFYFVKQQLISAIIGFLALIILSNIHFSFWKKLSPIIFAVSIISLIVVLLPGVGSKLLGARRWITIGGFNFQPSEFVKISLALFIAYLYDRKAPYWWYLATIGVLIGLIMLEPDLGTTIVVSSIGFVQIFLSGFPIMYMFGILGGGGVLGTLLILISKYRRERLFTFLSSIVDPIGKTADQASGSAYHIRQILIAVGSGGLFGVGLGQSRQKFLFLPETATDSIFAIIAEEIGFIGCFVLIGVFVYYIFRLIRIAKNAPDEFSTIFTIGVAAWIASQMFFNIGSMIALVPLTGIPLPFISYGGTSLIAILMAIGIVLNISKYANK